MAMYFSMCDVMQTAVEVEKNGEKFYKTLAERADNPAATKLFEALASEEKKHIAVFQEIQESVNRKPLVCEFDDETKQYINALAGEVFTKEKLDAVLKKKNMSAEDAIRHAADFEKSSILFFSELRDLVELHDAKVIDLMIEQEKAHLTKLLGGKSGGKPNSKKQ